MLLNTSWSDERISIKQKLDHWHRLVKNIRWANQNFGGNMVNNDKCKNVSQLLGGSVWAYPPKSALMSWTNERMLYKQKLDY